MSVAKIVFKLDCPIDNAAAVRVGSEIEARLEIARFVQSAKRRFRVADQKLSRRVRCQTVTHCKRVLSLPKTGYLKKGRKLLKNITNFIMLSCHSRSNLY